METIDNVEEDVNQTRPKLKGKRKKRPDTFLEKIPIFVRSLWATRQTEDIDKEKQMYKYVKITMRELTIYGVFLINLSIVALTMQPSTVFDFSNVISSSFTGSTTTHEPYITFMDIVHMNDIWRFMQDIYPKNFYSDGVTSKYIATENRILGLSRLRQVRVKRDSCIVPEDFRQEIRFCYADWSSNSEDQEPYGPYVTQNATNDTAWYYRTQKELKGSKHVGLMNSYGGGGYAVDLSSEKDETELLMSQLFDNLWVDRGTRAIFFDFTVYNANINIFCQVRLVFELPATGGVVPSYMVRPVKLLRYVSVTEYVILACEIVFAIFLFYYAIEEYLEIRKHGKAYFKMGIWSFVDILLIFLGVMCLVFNLFRQLKVDELLESLLQDDSKFFDFDFLCYWQIQFNNGMAGMVFLSWIKVFKYTSFNKTMSSLSMTLSRCAMDVAGFAVMFFIVFLAYAQLGYLVFGTQVHDFSTFERSIYTLFRIILGDFDFESLEAANRLLGPIFFLTYVFFVFFVLLNMFIAIINDSYGEIKAELASQKSDIELGMYLKKGYNKVLNKMNIKQNQILDIQKAITTADTDGDNMIDYIEWRNSLRSKGYSDVEIETLFARYDLDGDRVLNQEEQLNMMKDLADQNEQLREAMEAMESMEDECEDEDDEEKKLEEEKKKRRAEGVMYEDYSYLASRIDTMESSIGSITNKIEHVLKKVEKENPIMGGSAISYSTRTQSAKSRVSSGRLESNC